MKKAIKIIFIYIFEKTGIDWIFKLKNIRSKDIYTKKINKSEQIRLLLHYQSLKRQENENLPDFNNIIFRNFSQNGEDGILLYIFALIGFESRRSIEIGCGDGIESNTANLIIHHGFEGLLIDGDEQNIRYGKAFYRYCRDTSVYPPKLIKAWVNAENVNELFRENEVEGEIDVLSIDVDGMDYWIWDAIDCVSPRVIVAECNNLWAADESKTIPYNAAFVSDAPEYYAGASLAALTKLAKKKDYRLIGANRYGFNAFFLRNDIDKESKYLPEKTPAQCLDNPYSRYARRVKKEKIINRPWIEI